MRRKFFIIFWIVGVCVGWLVATSFGISWLRQNDPDLLQTIIRSVSDLGFLIGIFMVGPVVAMGLAAWLALRGVLPGTALSQPLVQPAAFPVITNNAGSDSGVE